MSSLDAESALRLAGLEPGDHFLDVSTGREDLSRAAAGAGACVRRAAWGPNHSLDFAADTFDVAVSWLDATPAPEALREMVRVTRPGGRVVAMAYRSPCEIDQFAVSALRAVVPDARFAVRRPQLLCRRLMGAGLKRVMYASADERLEIRNGRDLWTWVVAENMVAPPPVNGDQEAAIHFVLDGMLRERRTGALTAPVAVALGTKWHTTSAATPYIS